MQVRRLKIAVIILISALFVPVHTGYAVDPDEVLEDAALEKRARELSAGLRCVVCQNQSIDDSDAPLAKDLRRLVRERLKAGDSDREVMSYIVDRYGTFVLLKPPFAANTLLLWLLPFGIMLLAIFVAYRVLFRKGAGAATEQLAPVALSDDEQHRLDAVLKAEDSNPKP